MEKRKACIVPWREPEQFKKVYAYAYQGDICMKRWAFDQMGIWEHRCWPALPYAVEATSLCLQAQIEDALLDADKNVMRGTEVEALYNIAILRLLTLFVENERSENGFKDMKGIAKERGLSHMLVDMRHNIAHGVRPTLEMCRMACIEGLNYLEKIFWRPESVKIELLQKSFNVAKMTSMFTEYRKIQHERVLKNNMVSDKVKKEFKKVCGDIAKYLHRSKPGDCRRFLKVLSHRDHFVTQEDIQKLALSDAKFINLNDSDLALPQPVINFYLPLLRILHTYNCIPTFVEFLMEEQEHRTKKIFQKVADGLVALIIESAVIRGSTKSNKDLVKMFSKKSVLFDHRQLLFCVMKGCSAYYEVVAETLSQKVLVEDWKEDLSTLAQIRRGETLNKDKKRKHEEHVLSVGDIEDLVNTKKKKISRSSAEVNYGSWELAPISIDFSQMPMGAYLNPVRTPKAIGEKPVDEADEPAPEFPIKQEEVELEDETERCALSPTPLKITDITPRSSFFYDYN